MQSIFQYWMAKSFSLVLGGLGFFFAFFFSYLQSLPAQANKLNRMFYSQLLCCKSIIVLYLLEQRQSQFLPLSLAASLCVWKNTAPAAVLTKSLVAGWSCIILTSYLVSLNHYFCFKKACLGKPVGWQTRSVHACVK